MQITGAELFVKALLAEHVDTLFAYPVCKLDTPVVCSGGFDWWEKK